MEEKKLYTSEEALNLQSAAYQKGYNEGYELRKKEQPCAVWVKAVDRLPTTGLVVWRWLDKTEAYTGYKDKGGFYFGTGGARVDPTYYSEIEWLDESGAASNNDVIEFAEWLYKNRWFHFENGRWEYTFEQGSSVSRGEYLKNYIKTTADLHQLWQQSKSK